MQATIGQGGKKSLENLAKAFDESRPEMKVSRFCEMHSTDNLIWPAYDHLSDYRSKDCFEMPDKSPVCPNLELVLGPNDDFWSRIAV